MNKISKKFWNMVAHCVFRKPEVSFEEQPTDGEPCVYLANHSAASGPALMTLYFPIPHKTWMIEYALDKELGPNYCFHDVLFGRSKKCKPFYRGLSHVVAAFLRNVLSESNPIIVYHNAQIILTLHNSVKTLLNGESIVIFPENPERYSEYVSNIHSGFAEIGRLFAKNTAQKLKFYPVYVAHKLHKILVGKPTEYDIENDPKSERERIALFVRDNIERLARTLPPHKSTPFMAKIWYKYYGEYEFDTTSYWKLFQVKRSD